MVGSHQSYLGILSVQQLSSATGQQLTNFIQSRVNQLSNRRSRGDQGVGAFLASRNALFATSEGFAIVQDGD